MGQPAPDLSLQRRFPINTANNYPAALQHKQGNIQVQYPIVKLSSKVKQWLRLVDHPQIFHCSGDFQSIIE